MIMQLMRLSASALFLCITFPLPSAESRERPFIESVDFIDSCGKPVSAIHASIANDSPQWPSLQPTAMINAAKSAWDNYILLASYELLVAPNPLPAELNEEYLANQVAWGWLTSMTSIECQPIDILHSDDRLQSRFQSIYLSKMIKESFSGPDNLWPWQMKLTVYLLDGHANIIDKKQKTIRIYPVTSDPSKAK